MSVSFEIFYPIWQITQCCMYVTLALLSQQQSVNQAGPPLADYKKNIESNFKSLKADLAPKDKESVPKLPQNQKEW